MIDLKQLQKEAYENKVRKGFNTTNIECELVLIYGELAELARAYFKKLPDIGEELADVAIYLLGLSEMLGIDLEQEIVNKIEKNRRREYQKINSVLTRTKEG